MGQGHATPHASPHDTGEELWVTQYIPPERAERLHHQTVSSPSLRTSHGARSIEPEKIEQGSDARAHRGAQFIAMLVDELLLPGHAHGHENQSRLRLRSCRKTASVCAAEKYPS